ncbi:phosphomannomutase [Capsaspora owczarzaki ATCC 30864]|uniref:Phosphomannomutase n=1 Tax=Capsaspora owczarzaki (strain ATCC 30864) TaxID=595528 RepID=A0A0D2VGI8_CAPO3|nr:phosphomannomutase [Capsaspora owczarzaki ATCC 30864]KJE88992.1 phosphomannomutase [Capsaspora owczarzaki ATCC 30864]|eukprot:XP_004365427.1 phosphomannomutase [Capsaspora owczarzaki ATCC 30864]
MAARDESTLVLFDVDGTLTPSRLIISPQMKQLLQRLRERVNVGIVGGSDLPKIEEQLDTKTIGEDYDYVFSENGVVAKLHGENAPAQSVVKFLGEENLQELLNFVLRYIADLKIPKKRGTFIEMRQGMINISPIGRGCTHAERLEFFELDNKQGIRAAMVKALQEKFAHLSMKYSIGGQISIDVFPIGWDKTFCLTHLEPGKFKTIHFFGDKTSPGGNDYEIFSHSSVQGHTVLNPDDTAVQLNQLFFK